MVQFYIFLPLAYLLRFQNIIIHPFPERGYSIRFVSTKCLTIDPRQLVVTSINVA